MFNYEIVKHINITNVKKGVILFDYEYFLDIKWNYLFTPNTNKCFSIHTR
jgi:hypothetical protein